MSREYIDSIFKGSWQPVISNASANLATTTLYNARYLKAGSLVLCWINYNIQTSDTNQVSFELDLPIAVNLVDVRSIIGSGAFGYLDVVKVVGVVGSPGKVRVLLGPSATTLQTLDLHFSYEV